MERPKTISARLASEWVSHATCEHAWDDMRELVETEPDRAWRVIRAIAAAAPDYGILAAVAAGPLEDLIDQHGDTFMPLIAATAKESSRFRICLRATYSDFTPELKAMLEAEGADVRDLAPDADAKASSDDLALILGWLHHSDTAWAGEFLSELTETDPSGAWDVLRVLAVFAEEDTRIRNDVFEDAYRPFLQRHFPAFRDRLVTLGRKMTALRQWACEQTQSPIRDEAEWAAFVSDISVV